MRKTYEAEIKVGIFVSGGIALIMATILLLDDNHSFFASKNDYTAHFDRVDGLISGSKIILNGVPVGVVESIALDYAKKDIAVRFSINKIQGEWIRKGSTAEIATQGVLGDKYISINSGDHNEPILAPGSDIPNRPSKDLSQLFTSSDHLIMSLNRISLSLGRILTSFEENNRDEIFFEEMANTAKHLSQISEKLSQDVDSKALKKSLSNLSEIMEKVNNGTGSIGALINDPSLYDQLKALLGGANRNRIIRNLVRQTLKDSAEKSSEAAQEK